MKKTLLAASLVAAFAGSAAAADVSLYGRIDLGFGWSHADNGYDGATNSVAMTTGNYTSSRFGLKGEEALGDGYKVSFILENGYSPDTGALKTSNTIFDREATLHLTTPFGTFAAGRLAPLGTDGGSYNMLGGVSAFGTGLGDVASQGIVMAGLPTSRYSNTVTYLTPRIAGLQAQIRYAMGEEGTDAYENKSSTDHYLGLGVSYRAGNFDGVILYETVNEKTFGVKNKQAAKFKADRASDSIQDMWRITAGGNYDFGAAKLYLVGQYFEGADKIGSEGFATMTKKVLGTYDAEETKSNAFDQWRGAGVSVSAGIPLAGGELKVGGGWLKAKTKELAEGTVKAEGWYTGLGYTYSFSKTTRAVAAVGTSDVTYKLGSKELAKPNAVYGTLGIAHFF